MKDFIISASYVNFEDDYEVEQINEKYNKIVTSSGASENNPLEISRQFLSLCSLMEENGSSNPQDYSVLQFYSKLNYISEKIEREKESQTHG